MKSFKRLVAMGVVIALACFMAAGCGQKDPKSGAAGVPQELTVAILKDTGSLNPHLYDSDMGAQSLVYEPLVNLDKQGKIIPWLAKTWEMLDGGRKIIMRLREDVKFTDGQPFNAAAVKQNFDAVLANANDHSWLPLVDKIARVDVVDEYTAAFELKEPYPYFLLELTMVRPVRFLSPGGFASDGRTFARPIGTGPFILKEYEKDQKAVFVRNENYWGDKPKLEKVTLKLVTDPNTRISALMAGELDLLISTGETTVTYIDLLSLEKNSDLVTASQMGDICNFLSINPSREPLNDRAVREAVALTVNKHEIVQAAYKDKEKVAETMFSPRVPEVLGQTKAPARDVVKARRILAEAGWVDPDGDGYLEKNGKKLEFTYMLRSDVSSQKVVAEIIQAQLKEVGIKMDINAVERATYFDRKKSGEYGIMPDITWGIQYDPQSIFKSFRDYRPYLAGLFEGET
ncbi:MAG: nickel ABC transporter substrate-binding protein, partial [Firmicutes bacterium]|nr:nickel ABC transporter substrate-binding protein [Bacillota bacterium]